MRDGGADGVVQLQEVAERAVVVERVHLLVDGRGLGHEEEALLAAAGVQDVDGLERHLLETGKVERGGLLAEGVVAEGAEVRLVDVAVEPDGEVRAAEDAEGLVLGPELEQRRLVEADVVPGLGELGVVVLAVVAVLAGVELLRAAAKVDVGALVVRPGIVGHGAEGLVDEGPVCVARAAVARERDGSRVGDLGR